MYNPSPPSRFMNSAKNDSPCDCSCSDLPPYAPIAKRVFVELLDLGRDIEIAFGAQEISVAYASRASGEPEIVFQSRMRGAGRKREVAAAALGGEGGRHRNRLQ